MTKTRGTSRIRMALLAGAMLLAAAPQAALAQSRPYNIPSQPLADALREWGRSSGHHLLFTEELVRGRTAPAISGNYAPYEALDRLLRGSGLRAERGTNGSVMIRPASRERSSAGETMAGGAAANSESADQPNPGTPEEIVVTGTYIRGASPASPVVTVTQSEMRQAGQNSLGEVIRALPQNFSGGQNPGVAAGATSGGAANQNLTGSSTLNLRGLGPDATLTLVNGARMPNDGIRNTTDISVIPIAAIQRIELLLDGASALYGTDAVGGVANIVLRRDYDGAELSARYGGATGGGFEQRQLSLVAGHRWQSGGVIATADYSRNDAVRAGQRSYLSYQPFQDVTIYPQSRQASALISGHQQISGSAELAVDGFYVERTQEQLGQNTARFIDQRESTTWGIMPRLTFENASGWSFQMQSAYGRSEAEGYTLNTNIVSGAVLSEVRQCFCNSAISWGVQAEGPLLNLPGGSARASIGAGWIRNTFSLDNLLTGAATVSGARASRYAFAEVNLPLVSADLGIPLVRTLTVNAAARHERYDSFGSVLTPKVGVIWAPVEGLQLRATWGRSFKVPTLQDQFSDRILFLYPGPTFGAPAGTTILLTAGGNRDLEPERARIVTAGMRWRPAFLPAFEAELGYFNINYRGRILNPLVPAAQGLINPVFADFVIRSPTAEAQQGFVSAATRFTNLANTPYNPANVFAILQNSLQNAAADRITGFDLRLGYSAPLAGGSLSLSWSSTWLDSERRLTLLSAPLPTSGDVFFPASFRTRAGGAWRGAAITIAIYGNYIGGLRDARTAPVTREEGMATIDLIAEYRPRLPGLGEVAINVSMLNALNQAPPYMRPVQPYLVNYDSTNYSALGRQVSLRLTKAF